MVQPGWLAPTIIVLAALLSLWPLCTGEFTSWDDPQTVSQNPTLNPPTLHSIRVWWTSANLDLWDPATDMVRGALALIGTTQTPDPVTGSILNPYVFHTANLLIHIATALIVYHLLQFLLSVRVRGAGLSPHDSGEMQSKGVQSAAAEARIRWAACVGAVLFAVHPIQVESVGWVTAMKDLLCGLFSLAAIWRYLIYAERQVFQSRDREGAVTADHRTGVVTQAGVGKSQPHRLLTRAALEYQREFWIATALFVLATLSKPTAVVVPLMLISLNALVLQRRLRDVWRGMLLWIILALPCILITKLVQPGAHSAAVTYWKRFLVSGDALAFYLCKLVLPLRQGLDYGRTPNWIFQHGYAWWTWLLPAVIGTILFAQRRRAPLLFAGGVIFVLGLLPVMGLIPFDMQRYSTVSDHYLYLSMFGVALAAAGLVSILPPSGILPCFVILLALGLQSWNQSYSWQNSEKLFRHALEVNPESAPSFNSLAVFYQQHGDIAASVTCARRAIELDPNHAEGYVTLGAALAIQGNLAGAERAYRRGCQVNPQSVPALNNLSGVLAAQGQTAEALALTSRALELDPNSPEAHLNFGSLLFHQHDLSGAEREFRRVLELAPGKLDARYNLAATLEASGQREKAIQQYRAALQLDPGSELARVGLTRLGASTSNSRDSRLIP